MEAYTTAKYANYAHIHMYVFQEFFKNRLKEINLDNRVYDFSSMIDGNVVTWTLSTPDIDIVDALANSIHYFQPTTTGTEKATADVAKKNRKKV